MPRVAPKTDPTSDRNSADDQTDDEKLLRHMDETSRSNRRCRNDELQRGAVGHKLVSTPCSNNSIRKKEDLRPETGDLSHTSKALRPISRPVGELQRDGDLAIGRIELMREQRDETTNSPNNTLSRSFFCIGFANTSVAPAFLKS
jgi:hypothetical protein